MKRIKLCLAFLAMLILAGNIHASARAAESAQAANNGEKGKLTIEISGLKNDEGVVRVALFDSESAYKADKSNEGDQAFDKKAVEIKDHRAVCAFANVPYGEYAVKFFHDENNSGKFVTGMFGIPKVEYGFSNNARALLGPPTYNKVKFSFRENETLKLLTGSSDK